MTIKDILAYLLNPRTRVAQTTSGSVAAFEDDNEWSRPQLMSYGTSILNLPLILGLIVLLGLILIILFGPLWAKHDPNITTQAFIPYYDAELRDLRSSEALLLGDNFPFADVPGLSNEMVERLSSARPHNLAAAGRVRGITPAALAALLVHAKRRSQAA